MSVKYVPVQWGRFKVIYDVIAITMIMGFLWIFVNVTPGILNHDPAINPQIRNMRAFGSCAFFLLTAILMIGPLARLDDRFLPLLYNRRHLGVLTGFVALSHASFVVRWYFVFSPTDRYEALLGTNTAYDQILGFPFEAFGIFALLCLLVLATTSHDFWLKFLTPRIWKDLHYLIYPAYAAVIAHIGLGALQSTENPTFGVIVFLCASLVIILHLAAARKEHRTADAGVSSEEYASWRKLFRADTVKEGFARVARLSNGERIAVFRHGNRLSAIANACAHQNGPLGEGRIADCIVTCPWHGFQYDVTTGQSPAPFTEKIATYNLRLRDGYVEVDESPNPYGTVVTPLAIPTPSMS
ncbi:MAG: ferric reductase-like transmembrane domain-containing protein [Aestuariivita sp.]|nr:ferric reductase-like transmembrane domain-containing protein [Aestuariivita sp.]MCY4347338.1 ferric reductase-like transmembrane domain-containing protein [Aestuariivita sp.]